MSTKMNIHADPEVTYAVKELALEEFEGAGSPGTGSVEKYRRLRAIGTRLWLDTGDLEAASKVRSRESDARPTNST